MYQGNFNRPLEWPRETKNGKKTFKTNIRK